MTRLDIWEKTNCIEDTATEQITGRSKNKTGRLYQIKEEQKTDRDYEAQD
jgi:hypothetical protein